VQLSALSATEVERSGSVYLGRFGLEGEPGLGEEALDEGGPAQCPSRPPCSPSIRLGISKDREVAASVHADTRKLDEPVTTEQQPHTPLPWT